MHQTLNSWSGINSASLQYQHPRKCHIEQADITPKLQKEYNLFEKRFNGAQREYFEVIRIGEEHDWLHWQQDDVALKPLEGEKTLVYDETEEEWRERIGL